MPKVLMVEDDPETALTLLDCLEFENYTVDHAADGNAAMEYLRQYKYDLIVLDWNLPGMTGVEILRSFRHQGGQTPIIMLTGKSELMDKVQGFDAGADDYLTKPFHPKELIVRIRAVLKRGQTRHETLKAGPLEVDVDSRRVIKNGSELKLSPTEFDLLAFLVRHPGKVFSADTILDSVWPASSERSPDTLRTCIKKLRNKIDADGDQSLIRTVHGSGYSFDAGS